MVEIGWPLIALVIWTLLIRGFPSILGKAIEHRYKRNLETIKAELQASYLALETSVGFLSTAQSELRTKVIAATETLWRIVCAVENEFSTIMFFDYTMLPSEFDERLSDVSFRQMLEPYKDLLSCTDKLVRGGTSKATAERLFVGDRLWLVYSTITAVHGRFGFLMGESLKQEQYVNWKDDHRMNSLLESCLSKTDIGNAKGRRFGGFRIAVAQLEGEFLKEAARVMSGSQGFADSLSDVHAVLQYENQEIAARRDSAASV